MAPTRIIPGPIGGPPGPPVSRALAENLTSRGLHVHFPRKDDSENLKVSGAEGMSCSLSLDDEYGDVTEYLNIDPEHRQPRQVAAMIARILGVDYTAPGRYEHLHRGVTLGGAVGRDMQARGLSVTLEAFEDHDEFRVTAEVVIANPAQPQRGEVSISDDGWLAWDCYARELPGGIADLADTIAATLSVTSNGP